jgi:hypothetical protein
MASVLKRGQIQAGHTVSTKTAVDVRKSARVIKPSQSGLPATDRSGGLVILHGPGPIDVSEVHRRPLLTDSILSRHQAKQEAAGEAIPGPLVGFVYLPAARSVFGHSGGLPMIDVLLDLPAPGRSQPRCWWSEEIGADRLGPPDRKGGESPDPPELSMPGQWGRDVEAGL